MSNDPSETAPSSDIPPHEPVDADGTSDVDDLHEEDATRGEVMLYAIGNVESSVADHLPNLLQNILVVAAHVNPLMIGLVLGIKTLWDSVTDPLMAHLTDNTRSRWGRRRPYILAGGVLRTLLVIAFIYFMPTGGHLTPNTVMEAQKYASEAVAGAKEAQKATIKAYEQLPEMSDTSRKIILDRLPGLVERAQDASQKIAEHQGTLAKDFQERAEELEKREKHLASIEAANTNFTYSTITDAQGKVDIALESLEAANALDTNDANGESVIAKEHLQSAQASFETVRSNSAYSATVSAGGLVDAAHEKWQTADNLQNQIEQAKQKAIAAEMLGRHLLQDQGLSTETNLPTAESAQAAANLAYAKAGVDSLNILSLPTAAPPKPWKAKGMFSSISEGFTAFSNPKNGEQRSLIIYLLVGLLMFTTLTTINGVPYYALGIELSPSYNGRTQVATYRAVVQKVAGLVQPWVPVFCFSLWFVTAIDGLFWVAVFVAAIGIPCTVLMVMFTKERVYASAVQDAQKTNLFRSIWEIAKNPQFLRVFGLFTFITVVNGIFAQLGFYLNVYWVMGSALSGAVLGAWVGMLAWILGLLTLPLINWGCRRFQKHRVLMFALIWMAIGTAMKWWAVNPEHPEFQFILPFFFSVGIASVYTVLPTMLADVTDVDELLHGVRREGMFGAVNAFLMKMAAVLTPIIAGAILVFSGFDPSLEYEQAPSTIYNMRLMYSFVPASLLALALLLLVKYPLTRERVFEIKDELQKRRQAAHAAHLAQEAQTPEA